ncbi:MAG: sigma factor-like helix-turn-helix DNA-binding protein [Candidatus Berkelbacteria bacterium]
MSKIRGFSPYTIIKEAVRSLKANERKVVSDRFGINSEHKTLSAVGKELKLSRERIRQIEREGLRKLAVKIIEEQSTWIDKILDAFDRSGGVTSQDNIAEKFLDEVYVSNKNEFNSLHLIFVLIPQLIKIEKTRDLESGWMLASVTKKDAIKVIDDWADHLKKMQKPVHIDVLVQQFPQHSKYKIAFLSELPHISKKIVKTDVGLVGLSSWPEVNPKNIRDKIYFVLNKSKKPMHFYDIAEAIKNQSFDGKGVVRATVHNELIADDRFVLIGRGIYALKEWGYSEGTVLDVIKSILLTKKEGMTAVDIVKEVMKLRQVKKNTILINLQTKPIFRKIGTDKYALK